MGDDGVVGVVLTNERYQRLLFDAASCETARRLADDLDARIQRLTQERDDLRRQLAERDKAEREAEDGLDERVRGWREALGGNESRAWAVEQLRSHPGIGAGILMVAAGALEALATAPASAVAAVLPATPEDAESLRTIFARLHDVMVTTPGTGAGHVAVCALESAIDACEVDIFERTIIVEPIAPDDVERLVALFREAEREGRYMYETEDAIRAVAAAAIAHDRQRRAEQPATPRAEPEKYLRCEACGHEESEPFAPGDSHAGCDGPLLCVTCGTGIATSRAEPDEAALRKARSEPDAIKVGSPEHVELWDAINDVVAASGGSVSCTSGQRMDAVARVESALRAIVARYGSPPTVPVLALPSVEEVDEVAARAVLDLIRDAQPAAELAEHARQLRVWLTNADLAPDDETIEAMWLLVNALDQDGDEEPQP